MDRRHASGSWDRSKQALARQAPARKNAILMLADLTGKTPEQIG
jgi:hypothetical protein